MLDDRTSTSSWIICFVCFVLFCFVLFCFVLFCYMILTVRVRYHFEQHEVGGRNGNFTSVENISQ
jgi:hypothetical protein